MVDSMSTLSSLEITRNPFDSSFEDRTNYPGFSPSMFSKQETPASERKRRTFRWSIDQISRLNPADIDEFPNQEYSSTFEREEDEIETQKAIDEYFSQGAIVPSPWTPNNPVKHVKFSPLPPATAYIEAESSRESSYCSPNSSNCKIKADASSQTKLSLPPDFDLQSHLDPACYNQEVQDTSRDVSLSSLRRKLFTQEEKRTKAEKDLLEVPNNIKSILKSPKTPVLVTSSPVSEKLTPRHNTHRHSSASTMSSPNISPIKPLIVTETPTPTGRPRFARQTMSPMDFSVQVLESSGIEGGGVVFPDLSPIKENRSKQREHIQEMDVDNGDAKENLNDSVDDGGPLEVSALSVKDDNIMQEEESGSSDNGDEEMPPKITIEDLADVSDLSDESSKENSGDSSPMKFVELTPRESPAPESHVTETMDVDDKGSEAAANESCVSPESLSKEGRMKVEEIGSSFRHDAMTVNPGLLKHGKAWEHHGVSTLGRDYSSKTSYHRLNQFSDLDEDVILMRAKAALRRAEKYSPPKESSFSLAPHSLSELSLNASTQTWHPVGMSTPLIPLTAAPTSSMGHVGHNSRYGYKSGYGSQPGPGRSVGYDSAALTFGEESGLGRSGGEAVSQYLYGISGRRQSPIMEDFNRRRKHSNSEAHLRYSTLWKRPGSPPFSSKYQSKYQLSRTYPMTYLEWKALHWRPTREADAWSSKNWYHADPSPYRAEFKRSSWPPSRPFSSKSTHGSRTLSPPVTFPPAKVPRAVPGGSVSKMALPSYHDSGDSGFSDWRRSVSRWESAIRNQHSIMGNTGEFHYY